MTSGNDPVVRGLREAVAQFGPPQQRSYFYPVTLGSLGYWRKVLQKRSAEVVPVVILPGGRLLVHTKSFYPHQGDGRATYRLLSGGIHPGEALGAALLRETHEETNLQVRVERFMGILSHVFAPAPEAVSPQWPAESRLLFTSYIFALRQVGGQLLANDPSESIAGFDQVRLDELPAIASALEHLEAGWQDWGRFRATTHRFVAEVLDPTLLLDPTPPESPHHVG